MLSAKEIKEIELLAKENRQNIVKMVQINLSVAPILMFVLAILLLAGSKRTKKYKAIDREYDNPDVSYAPYVVK